MCKYCDLHLDHSDSDYTDEYDSRFDFYVGNELPILESNGKANISLFKVNGFTEYASIEFQDEESIENNTGASLFIPIRFCPYCGKPLANNLNSYGDA